jgi:hypothetical protein
VRDREMLVTIMTTRVIVIDRRALATIEALASTFVP